MTQHISLNGDWRMTWYDGQRGHVRERVIEAAADLTHTFPAQVPGSIHLDLIRAGLLAEPTVGLNHLAARWVEETIWHYRRTFDAPALAPGERAWLIFERLDLAAVIYLNGVEVGPARQRLLPLPPRCHRALREGENVLVVELEAGLFHAGDRPGDGYGMHIDCRAAQAQLAAQVAVLLRLGLVDPPAQCGHQRRRALEIGVRRAASIGWSPWPTVSDDLRQRRGARRASSSRA